MLMLVWNVLAALRVSWPGPTMFRPVAELVTTELIVAVPDV